jgi:hypothetical protein
VRREREFGVPWPSRNRRFTEVGAADFGEPFGQPGGMIWRGKKGKMERREGAIYRRGRDIELNRQ